MAEPWLEAGARSISTSRAASDLLSAISRRRELGMRITANASGGEAIAMALRTLNLYGHWEVSIPEYIEVFDDCVTPIPLVSYVDGGRTYFIGDDSEIDRIFG